MTEQIKRARQRETGIRVFLSACGVIAVSGIIRVYGLDDVIFFNKGAVSLGFFFLCFFMLPAVYRHWKEERRDFFIGYAMALGLVFTEVLGTGMRLEVVRGGVRLTLSGVLVLAMASLIPALLAEPFFHRLIRFSFGSSSKGREVSPDRAFLIWWGLLSAWYLLCALAFYPGLYCYDMGWQWSQFVGWNFTTHHPLLHTLFGGGLIELGRIILGSYNRGLFFHSLVQLLFMSASMALALRFLVKRKTHPAAVRLAGGFFLLFPFFPVLGISTTKDTMFGIFFLVVFVCICDMVEERRFYRGRRLAAFMAAAVIMCLFRNNAVYGLGILTCCLLLVWLIRVMAHRGGSGVLLRAALLSVTCMVLSCGLFAALEKGLHADKGGREEMMSLPMQQMARSYVYHQEEFSPENREEFLRFFDESWVMRYKYYVSDPVKAGMRMENFELVPFLRLWMKLGMQFPGEYLKSPLYNMMGLWYMGGDSSCYMEYSMSSPIDEVRAVETVSKLPFLKDYYSWFTDEHLQKYLPGISVFFYTSFYSWCVILAAGVLLAKRKYLQLLLPLFLVSYSFTLIFGPCMIVRYFMGVMLCIPVLVAATFEDDKTNKR